MCPWNYPRSRVQPRTRVRPWTHALPLSDNKASHPAARRLQSRTVAKRRRTVRVARRLLSEGPARRRHAFLRCALELAAWREQVVAARETAYADVRAEALNTPRGAATGMFLTERKRIPELEGYDHANPISLRTTLISSRSLVAAVRAASAKSAPFDA